MIKIINTSNKKTIELDAVNWEDAKVLCYADGGLHAIMMYERDQGYIFRILDGGGMLGYQGTKKECCEKVLSFNPDKYELYLVD